MRDTSGCREGVQWLERIFALLTAVGFVVALAAMGTGRLHREPRRETPLRTNLAQPRSVVRSHPISNTRVPPRLVAP